MKKLLLTIMAVTSLGLAGCSDEQIAVSGSQAVDEKITVDGIADGTAYDFVYADDMYQQELADRIKDRVFFKYDSSSLESQAIETVNAQIAWLKANPSKSVTIEGHCDERGTREYNLGLGDRRANAVKRYMIANGIAPTRIKLVSYGKERPALLGNNPAAWAQNRRAVTIIRD